MTNAQVSELIHVLTQRHHEKIERLTTLFDSEGGFEVFDLASKVIGDPFSAADWLTSRQIGLNGAIPAAAALDAEGREAVRTYLHQIDHGVYV